MVTLLVPDCVFRYVVLVVDAGGMGGGIRACCRVAKPGLQQSLHSRKQDVARFDFPSDASGADQHILWFAERTPWGATTVLTLPTSDVTPLGRIVNRFSKDMDQIDVLLSDCTGQLFLYSMTLSTMYRLRSSDVVLTKV